MYMAAHRMARGNTRCFSRVPCGIMRTSESSWRNGANKMRVDVFISYSSKDKALADALVHFLEEKKIRCWIAPNNIVAGQSYADSIVEALQAVKAVVFLHSRNSLASHWCKSEIDRALGFGKTIIPFRIDDAETPAGWQLYLATQHWIDAVPNPEMMFGKIARDIRLILNSDEDVSPKVDDAPAYPSGQKQSDRSHFASSESHGQRKSRRTYQLLAFFLGFCGAHNFYAGYTNRAIVQLAICLCSFFFLSSAVWIWAVIEAVNTTKDSDGLPFV